MESLGGFSGGDTITSGMKIEASLKGNTGMLLFRWILSSSIYLTATIILVSGLFPYLQFTLLIKARKPFFVPGYWSGTHDDFRKVHNSSVSYNQFRLAAALMSFTGNESDFLELFTAISPLHTMRHTMTNI